MEKIHKDALKKNRVELGKNLIVDDDFLNYFRRDDLLTEAMAEEIMGKKTKSAKASHFLDTIHRRGGKAFDRIIEAMVATSAEDLAELLDPVLTSSWMQRLRHTAPPAEPKMEPWDTENPIMSPVIECMQMVSPSDPRLQDKMHVYEMSHRPRGRALIINNYTFDDKKLPFREGAQFDQQNLMLLFEKLHFETDLHVNKSKEDIILTLCDETRRKEHRDADALVVCLLSHGANGVVYSSDGGAVDIESVIRMFDAQNFPAMNGKPKIFLIQACQGKLETPGKIAPDGPMAQESQGGDEDSEIDASPEFKSGIDRLANMVQNLSLGDTDIEKMLPEANSRHEMADMLIAYATVPGYKSYRATDLGTWFVRAFVNEVSQCAHDKHLVEILTRVRNRVHSNKTNALHYEACHNLQLTENRDRLLRSFYFFPGYPPTANRLL